MATQKQINDLTYTIIGFAIEMHKVLINFNCTNIFKEGQKTMVTEHFSQLPKGY